MPSDFLTPFLELEEEFCKVSPTRTAENKNPLDFLQSLSVPPSVQNATKTRLTVTFAHFCPP